MIGNFRRGALLKLALVLFLGILAMGWSHSAEHTCSEDYNDTSACWVCICGGLLASCAIPIIYSRAQVFARIKPIVKHRIGVIAECQQSRAPPSRFGVLRYCIVY